MTCELYIKSLILALQNRGGIGAVWSKIIPQTGDIVCCRGFLPRHLLLCVPCIGSTLGFAEYSRLYTLHPTLYSLPATYLHRNLIGT